MFYAQMAPTADAGLIVATPTRRAPPVLTTLYFFDPPPALVGSDRRMDGSKTFQNDSGLPQGPAAPFIGRLLMHQTACARRSLAGMIGGGTLGREAPCLA